MERVRVVMGEFPRRRILARGMLIRVSRVVSRCEFLTEINLRATAADLGKSGENVGYPPPPSIFEIMRVRACN